MKKKLILVMTAVLCFSMAACGKTEETTEATTEGPSVAAEEAVITSQDEIVQLVNTDLPAIAGDRDSAVAIYNAYYEEGAEIDSETWKTQLIDTAIPTYDAYLEKLRALSYTNGEVQNLLDIYIKSAEYQKEAMQDVVDAITNVDTDMLDAANSAVTDSKTYMKMYEDELTRLCATYGIDMVGQFDASETDATATDAE